MRRPSPLYLVLTFLVIAALACDMGGVVPDLSTPAAPRPSPTPRVSVPPVVADTFPARGDELKIDEGVDVYFDQPMDRASVEAAFSMEPKIEGAFTWKDDATLKFKPAQPLQRASRYKVTINNTAKSKDGLTMPSPYSFNADTVGFLEVSQVLPAPDAKDIESKSAITIMFNRPVVPLGISTSTANLPVPVTFEPAIEGKGEWLNTSIYVFKPTTGLAGGAKYTARIKAGLADVTGGVLKEDFTWSFSTQPPKVTKFLPAAGARDITLRQPITVTFSQAMDTASVQRAFALTDLGGRLVPGAFKWDEASTVMTFIPNSNLALATTHKVNISTEAKGSDGNTALTAATAWQFSTVLAPAVVVTRPGSGPEVDPFGGFRIEFTSPMDRATLEKNITIIPEAKATYTSYSGKSFYMGYQFKPLTDYTVTINGDMADVYGNKLGKSTTVKFKTRGYEPYLALNTRGEVGLYSAYLPTTLYATYRNYNNLRFRLYKMPLEDFAQYTGNSGYLFRQTYKPKELVNDLRLTVKDFPNENAFAKVDLGKGKALDPGIYYLEADGPHGKLQHALVVSKINLTMKVTFKEVLVWATDLRSGLPAANVPVVIRNAAFGQIANGTTDEKGLYRAPLPTFLNDLFQTIYATSSSDPNTFALAHSEWSDGVEPWDFNLESNFYTKTDEVYVYTDRPVYRAGQTMYFKGVARSESDARFSTPDIKDLRVLITNDEGQTVYTDTLKLSPYGTFNGQFTLAEDAGSGYYNVRVNATDPKRFTGGIGFQVAQYRKPEFLVNVTPEKLEVTQGNTVKATVESTFYFGGAVSNAKVKWAVLSANYFFDYQGQGYYDFSDFDYTAGRDSESYGVFGETIATGEGVTDSTGKLVISLPADLGKRTSSQKFTIEATVTDVNNQEVSGRTEVTVHKGDFYLGIGPDKFVARAGEDAAFNVLALDQQGKPRPNLKLSVSLFKHEWLNVQEQDEFGNNVWTWKPKDTQVSATEVTTNDKGQAVATFKPEIGGTYKAIVSALDAGGRQVTAASYIWVTARDFISWRQENNNRLQLVADKNLYKAGDTASILIPSPFTGETRALVTVERGSILKTEVITLDSNSYLYKLPITSEFAPNAFVSVVLVKGTDDKNPSPAFRVGLLPLVVSNEDQALKVTLTPDKPKAGPRETVTYKVKTTNSAGVPVKSEVSLALVDLAVLSLVEPNSVNILDNFYGKRGLGVRTSLGLTLSVDDLNVQTAKVKGGGGGGGQGFLEVRGDFRDTAFWQAEVVTDDKGEATVAIKLPDNLTTWRLDARAVSAEYTLVGQNTVDIVATKDLLIRPVTPRFFVVGDEAKLAAIVNNNTDKDLSVEVSLTGKGIVLAAGSNVKQTVTVKAKDRTRVEWPVSAADAAVADLTFSAVSGSLQDASKPTLGTPPDQTIPILKYIAPETAGTAGQLDGQASIMELIALPKRYDASQGELKLSVAPSLAASMTSGLNYLQHYPYECTEQTISRFLPNVISYNTLKKLGVTDAALEAELKKQVNVGTQKLYANQHADGGWGWWVTDRSDAYITSYVLFGLARAKAAGFEVDARALKLGTDYLKKQIRNPNEVRTTWEMNRQAFLLYTLVDAGDKSVTSSVTNLYEARGKLDTYARAYLALTLATLDSGDTRITTLLSDINNTAITSATGVHWEENARDWWNMNSDTRSTAIVLSAMARLDPNNKLNASVVRWLMQARKADRWETTQETAWALIGLTDYMSATGELKGNYTYNVLVNSTKVGGATVSDANVRKSNELTVKIADLVKDQANRIIFDRGAGEGKLYYSAYLTVYQQVKDLKALNKGIIVARQYFLDDGVCGTKGQAACPQVTSVNNGQNVTVKVSVIAPNDLYHVVVEDPFPAGMEPIDTSLKTTSVVGKPPTLKAEDPLYYGWGWWWFSKTDIRDNKVMLSASYLPKGTYVYTYSLHASLAGTYQVIPTTAQEFYFPDVMGRGEGTVFTIK